MIRTAFRPSALSVVFLLGIAAPLSGAVPAEFSPKLDPTLNRLLHAEGGDGVTGAAAASGFDVIVTGRLDRAALARIDAIPRTLLPGVATFHLTADRIAALAALPEVVRIQAASPLEQLMDATANEADAVDTWGGPAPEFGPGGHTGKGVIVGVIDTGFDITHPDFKNADGTTRVRFVWEQANLQGPSPAGFTYGREWTAAQINGGGAINIQDINGHGTHVAGTAVGNGRATGSGQPQYKYVGMAPEADIVLVQLAVVNDAFLIDAMHYIDAKAAGLGEDAVILLTSGRRTGPHDGTDPLDVAVDAISGPGRIVVAAAGNDGKTKKHGMANVTASGQTGTVTVNIPSYSLTGSNSLDIDAWTNAGRTFSVRVTTPGGYVLGPIPVQEQFGSITTPNGYFFVNMPAPTGPGQQIHIWMDTPSSGDWRFEIIGGSAPPGEVHFWIGDTYLGTANPVVTTGLTTMGTLVAPATATKAVSVSAYTVKKYWYDMYGGLKFYTTAVVGGIADFSSQGPRRDGVIKPDLAASGYGVAAAKSAQAVVFSGDIVQDGVHRMMTGTSVSAAVTAGAIALLLEQFPGLDPASVKAILRSRALTDSKTGSVPNPIWGTGKLCLTPTATTGIADPGISAGGLALGAAYPNPVRELTRVPVEVTEPSPVTIGVFDVAGHLVRSVHDGELAPGHYEFVWDGVDEGGRLVASGRYYIVATDTAARRSRAITVIR